MQQRRATEATWSTSGYILAAGELGVTTDTGVIKIGDGVNTWSSLSAAFGSKYLPILGTAADSSLLGGVSPANYVKFTDTATAATADKIVKRLSDGRVKAAVGTATDDVVTLAQLTSQSIIRTVTASFTLALTDIGQRIVANSSSYATNITCTVPPNSSVAFPVGSFVDLVTGDKGPLVLAAGAGVTINGAIPIYGGGGNGRLIKTATDTWRLVGVVQSPPPLLRRLILTGSGNTLTSASFQSLRLDSADAPTHTFSNNADTLGAGEQWSSAANTKCYCRREGWYDVFLQMGTSGNIASRMLIEPQFNGNTGSDYLGSLSTKGTAQYDITVSYRGLIPMHVGDYMEAVAYQDSGASQTIQHQSYASSMVEWVWRRPL
jgi:hypothetical protein